MPAGPLLFSPTNLMSGIIAEVVPYRHKAPSNPIGQVVTKTPDVQKTQTIEELWHLFHQDEPHSSATIVAGYGNKETDVKAYSNAGLPRNR